MSKQTDTLYDANVELYDIAFDWDLTPEVDWILERLGQDCRSVLEPACGSGRMLEAIGKRGIEIFGFDRSPGAIAFAKQRLLGIKNASADVGEMTSFSLKRVFDGAICPVNTLAHLSPEELAQHLRCTAQHLKPGARYLVQVSLRDPAALKLADHIIEWEASRRDTKLNMSVRIVRFDIENSRELHLFRIEVLSGRRSCEILEETHWMTMWTENAWKKLVAASSFEEVAQYDGDQDERPPVRIGQTGKLMWHELRRR